MLHSWMQGQHKPMIKLPKSSKHENIPEFQSLRTWLWITTVAPGWAVTTCAMLKRSPYEVCKYEKINDLFQLIPNKCDWIQFYRTCTGG